MSRVESFSEAEPLTEQLKLLSYARLHWIPLNDNGRPKNPCTVWRWSHKGFQFPDGTEIKLEVTYVGGKPMTSSAAVARFFQRVTEARLAADFAADVPADRPAERPPATARKLKQAGLM